MSQTLFPAIQPVAESTPTALPLCRNIKIDFAAGRAVFRSGAPVIVEGREAVLSWAWMALHTTRFRHEIFSWAYGCEVESLIGQPYTEALKQSEARRYLSECLMVSPYITGVDDISVSFESGTLTISCAITTIYGREELTTNV